MPNVDQWMQKQLSLYDKALYLHWNKQIERYEVLRLGQEDIHTVMVLQDRHGNFLRPHPNLILYGDKELGILGLAKRDTWRESKPSAWVDKFFEKEESEKKRIVKNKLDLYRSIGKDMYRTSLINPRVYVKSPL